MAVNASAILKVSHPLHLFLLRVYAAINTKFHIPTEKRKYLAHY